MRNLADVIDRMLAVIPAEREDLHGALGELRSSYTWSAPECHQFWFCEVGRTLAAGIWAGPFGPWAKAVREIWSGVDED